MLKHLNAKQGDGVVFRLQDDSTVNIEKKKKKIELPQGVDLDFIKMVNEVMDEYDKAIKELTKR
ncbi:AbrB family transcriptional regulator [Terrilactibacillus sp. S3-3]|nr:AbrB family transcriptional regulator [Terrilactibacillus sp. S3-3]